MSQTAGVAVGPLRTATVVLVGFTKQEQIFLQEVFDCHDCPLAADCSWEFKPKISVEATLATLKRDRIPVILCDRDLAPGVWKDLLDRFELLSHPPCLIVTSRVADDHLWAEALNLGAYDVLARPFDRAELVRTVGQARLHYQNRSAMRPVAMRTVA